MYSIPFFSLIFIQLFFLCSHHHGRVLRNSCFCLTHWAVHCFSPAVQDQPSLPASAARSSFFGILAVLVSCLLLRLLFKAAWLEACCLITAGSRGRNADDPLRCALRTESRNKQKNLRNAVEAGCEGKKATRIKESVICDPTIPPVCH